MLRSIEDLRGYKILAKDGEIGHVYDFYFDDRNWTIRYLVVDTGKWLPGRRVLISPASLDTPEWDNKKFPVNLTKRQVENSPDISEKKPVSRQQELEMIKYYGWPVYWTVGGTHIPGTTNVIPGAIAAAGESEDERKSYQQVQENINLRSAKEVIDYHIEAIDGDIGHVEDFLAEDENWNLHYLIVDTRNWLPGKKVIIYQEWFERVDWTESKMYLDLKKQNIENSPEFQGLPMPRDYEKKLHAFYKHLKET